MISLQPTRTADGTECILPAGIAGRLKENEQTIASARMPPGEERGTLAIKRKGDMTTYFLAGGCWDLC